MILVDTSVWVDHLRSGNRLLVNHLQDERVLCHPFVIGELSCGTIRNRAEILALLSAVPSALVADHLEVLHFVDSNKLFGSGLGWIDAHLLASALLSNCRLLTLDKKLFEAAKTLGIAAS